MAKDCSNHDIMSQFIKSLVLKVIKLRKKWNEKRSLRAAGFNKASGAKPTSV